MTLLHRIEPHEKTFVTVNGKDMAYVQLGEGEPVVLFLHGNPTSSYLWRNVMPELAHLGTCIAPDLIGMGDSAKLEPGPEAYRYASHREFLWGFVEAVAGTDRPVWLVLHDWGGALGFEWARYHADRVQGIAYMETIVRPLSWEEWPERSRALFQALRSEAGEELILARNVFVERVLPGSILRTLEPAELDEYRRPFAGAEQDRWPTLSWPRALPIDGEPADVSEIVRSYAEWLAWDQVPKLFVNAEPGAILTRPQRDFCRRWPNQSEVTVSAVHFVQEDAGPEIGQAIAEWIDETAASG